MRKFERNKMKMLWAAFLFLFMISISVFEGLCQGQTSDSMKITSAAFENNGNIPKDFG